MEAGMPEGTFAKHFGFILHIHLVKEPIESCWKEEGYAVVVK